MPNDKEASPEVREHIKQAIKTGRVDFPDDVRPDEMPTKPGYPRPEFEPRIRSVEFWSGGMRIDWAASGFGFGSLTIFRANKGVIIDSESMSPESSKKILCALVDHFGVEH